MPSDAPHHPPGTIEHFAAWAELLILDNGQPYVLQPYELEIFRDVLAGYREVLAVLPTGSGKTTMFAAFALYHLLYEPDAQVPIGAASREQAAILYRQAAGFVLRSPGLGRKLRVQEGYKRIIGQPETRWATSEMRVYAASDQTGDGIIPSLALIDELHRHKGHDLYGTWRDKLTKRDGQMVTLSTAGDSEDNPLEQLRDAAKRLPDGELSVDGRHTVARSKGREFVLHEWALWPGDDVDDLELVKMVNPAPWVTTEELRMRRDSPSTKPWQWMRFTCNLRVKGEESAIPPQEFDGREDAGLELDPDTPTWIGLDVAWKIDHAALTPLAWESPDRRLVANAITIAPPVSEEQIVRALLELAEALNVVGVVYDPAAGAEQMVQLLEKGQHPLQTDDDERLAVGLPALNGRRLEPIRFIRHSQDTAPMVLASARFDEAWRLGWIRHDGSARCSTPGCRCGGFRGHVLNAVVRSVSGEKWRYDRPNDAKGAKRARFPIDGFTGLLMAHSVAVAEAEKPRIALSEYRIGVL